MSSNIAPTPSSEPLRWNPIVISSVAAVCVIFLIFSYYRILQRMCCAHNVAASSRRVQMQLLNEANPDDPSLQFHSHGLESSIIHSLPITQFKKKDEEEPNPSTTDCAVCLGDFEEGEWLKHLPNCTHAFHVSCIDIWFQSHSNCPLCRSQVFDLTLQHEVSMYTMLETLRREDFFHERAVQYQIMRTEVLQNSALRHEATGNLSSKRSNNGAKSDSKSFGSYGTSKLQTKKI